MRNGKELPLNIYLYNNSCRLHGLPMRRKAFYSKHKRGYIRQELMETIDAFLAWCNE